MDNSPDYGSGDSRAIQINLSPSMDGIVTKDASETYEVAIRTIADFERRHILSLTESFWSNIRIGHHLGRSDMVVAWCWQQWITEEIVYCGERPMTLHSPTENSLAVLNHKILEANSQVQNVKLSGHQTCLSINRLRHELCDMLRRPLEITAPGHHDCSIQE
ncbi:uncharacterized protein TNCV_3039541 [Trichonephila clavipes]|uniref:Uncharacterized protein n=1 Tax=Trichonephila clavipes TaxID=2585209 RepID=A0A8X6VAY2_TRICX|nr:uncharacterized protein TNCV_3039541 [Trichonephila clavipes]